MSTAARKVRKREGIKFEHEPKIPTPVMQRSYVRAAVQGAPSTKHQGSLRERSAKKIARFIEGRTLNMPKES